MRILVAEPNPLKQDFLHRHLVEEGWQVQLCSSGVEAWKILREDGSPRIALVGSSLAGFSAKQLGQELRSSINHPHVYLILIAGREERPTVEAALAEGWADDVLLEPVDTYELLVRLQTSRRTLALREKLAQMEETAQRNSSRDGLTKLWNREATLDFMLKELNASARSKRPVAVVLLSLEKLDRINREGGLEAGDAQLVRTAQTLQMFLRTSDWVGRFAGNKFLIVLPGCGEKRATQVEDRLVRSIVARLNLLQGAPEPGAIRSAAISIQGDKLDIQQLLNDLQAKLEIAFEDPPE